MKKKTKKTKTRRKEKKKKEEESQTYLCVSDYFNQNGQKNHTSEIY